MLALDDRPFTARMASAAGIDRNALHELVRVGEVRRLLQRVYVAAAVPDSLDLRARAAALVLPEHAVVSDRCAAWLLGVDVLDFEEHDVVPHLDVMSYGGNAPVRRAQVLGGERDLLRDEVTTLPGGVRVTTPLRTACDIGRLYGRYRALATIDEFRRAYGFGVQDFVEVLPRFRGRRGVIQLRALVALSTDRADSQPESWVRLMMIDAGFPAPEPQVDVLVPEWGAARLENAYEHLRVAVEYDGVQFHTAAPDRERDDVRRAALAAAGWVVLVVRREDLGAQQRDRWLRELREVMARRTPPSPGKRRYARGP